MSTLLDNDTRIKDKTQAGDPGDHDKFSHYVPKDKILESAMSGEPIRALCGKIWLPNSDPQRFPVCPDCTKVYETMQQ